MRNTSEQSGFSAVEALLIFVIIGIIGFAGYFVYHAQKSTNKTLSETGASSALSTKSKATDANTPATSIKTDSQPYLRISQWGVRMTLAEPITDATYDYLTGNDATSYGGSEVIKLYTSSINKELDCKLDGGVILKLKGNDTVGDPDAHITAEYIEMHSASYPNVQLKHVGTSYYWHKQNDGAYCSNVNGSMSTTEMAHRTAFDTAFSTLEVDK